MTINSQSPLGEFSEHCAWEILLADSLTFRSTPFLNRSILSGRLAANSATIYTLSPESIVQILPISSLQRVRPPFPWVLVGKLSAVLGGYWLLLLGVMRWFAPTEMDKYVTVALPILVAGLLSISGIIFYYYYRDWWLKVKVMNVGMSPEEMYITIKRPLFGNKDEEKQLLLLQEQLQQYMKSLAI